jgi:hypothetical protein
VKLEKKLAPGEMRYIAKLFDAKKKLWGIYDKARGSWPVTRPDIGDVKQELKLESDAQAEADRLNKEHPVRDEAAPAPRSSRAKKTGSSGSSKTVKAADVAKEEAAPEMLVEPDLPVYEISEEDRAKYEENLD